MTEWRFQPLPQGYPTGTTDNGAELTRLFAIDGPERITTIFLTRRAIYPLLTSIQMGNGQHIATEGYPSFESGEMAALETVGDDACAINMCNKSNCSIRSIHINGRRGWGRHGPIDEEDKQRMLGEGKLGWIEGGAALVLAGGPQSQDCLVEGCRLEDPRGWTAVHVVDWAQRATIRGNIVGPCGQEPPKGPWADGLSIAGKDSIIEHNTIIDATDGQIVVFCAPGSQIRYNTIISRTRNALGGINLVDDFPFNCDYSNTRVHDNHVRSEGAFIHLGIGIGPTCWSPWTEGHQRNVGGNVHGNTIGPGTLGYGIAISGAKDFTVQGNQVALGACFTGSSHEPGFGSAPPTAFLIDPRFSENCNIQDNFIEGEASWLIGIRDGKGANRFYRNGQLKLDSEGNGTSGSEGICLEGVKVELASNGILHFREESSGRNLWSSGIGKPNDDYDPTLEFQDNQLVIKSKQNHVLWNPTNYLKSYLATSSTLQPLKEKVLDACAQGAVLLSNEKPFVKVANPNGDITFASHYEFKRGFELQGGNFIAIAPVDIRGTDNGQQEERRSSAPPVPPRSNNLGSFLKKGMEEITNSLQKSQLAPMIPPRISSSSNVYKLKTKPTFLFLNPITAQLVLHSSPSPSHPLEEFTHWCVPENPSEDIDGCWLVFQPGDGNLVLYVQKGDIGVPWTSGTNGDDIDRIILKGIDEGGPSLSIVTKNGEIRYTSC